MEDIPKNVDQEQVGLRKRVTRADVSVIFAVLAVIFFQVPSTASVFATVGILVGAFALKGSSRTRALWGIGIAMVALLLTVTYVSDAPTPSPDATTETVASGVPVASSVSSTTPTQPPAVTQTSPMPLSQALQLYNSAFYASYSGGDIGPLVDVTGTVINTIPLIPAFASVGNSVIIKDGIYTAAIHNVTDSDFQNIAFGDLVEVKGEMQGGGDDVVKDPPQFYSTYEPIIVTVLKVGTPPTPAAVLQLTEFDIQKHQSDINAAVQSVNLSSSISQCDVVIQTLGDDLCSNVGLGNDCNLPQEYSASNAAISTATNALLGACLEKFDSN